MLDLRDEMRKAGVECEARIVLDGKIHRFKVPGSRKANGWYVFDRDGEKVFGAYGDWKTGISSTIGKQTAAIREVRQQRNIDADVRALKAAKRAQAEWDTSISIMCDEVHAPYLFRKQVYALGVRRAVLSLSTLVPMRRGDQIIGLQSIREDGDKRFTPGCSKRGASHFIEAPGKAVVLCEGYATGASIHMATRLPVVVAFDCGNLLPAAREFAKHREVEKWIVAADDDRNTAGNPGISKAVEAAEALKGRIAVPKCTGSDFNDMQLEQGLAAVADAIYACL